MSAGDRDVAVVTGGAGAIGAAVCHRLAAAGRTVVVVDLDAGAAQDLAGRLDGDGSRRRRSRCRGHRGGRGGAGQGRSRRRSGRDVDQRRGVGSVRAVRRHHTRVLGSGDRHQLPRHAQHRARGVARDDRAAARTHRVGGVRRGEGRLVVGVDLCRRQGCGDLVLEERRPRGGSSRHHGQCGLPGANRHTARSAAWPTSSAQASGSSTR